MARKLISMAVLAASVTTTIVPSVAMARDYDRNRSEQVRGYADDGWYGDQRDYRDSYRRRVSDDGYDRRAYNRAHGREGYYAQNGYRSDQVYRGSDRYYRQRCDGGNGAVGTVVGGAGGAVLGNAFGGGTLGTVLGGLGGALLGRHLDKKHTIERNGC
ncbi:glycine zipper 2TM domain-containing protein [Rhizorhabdus argentea]|uniref:glycine zipper 2TM domain-containing protein n=1 Tax=Rhizorhabdus argentea TaxID=1387174 RepID=UPI0030EBBF8D